MRVGEREREMKDKKRMIEERGRKREWGSIRRRDGKEKKSLDLG